MIRDRVRVPMTMSGYCQHPTTPDHEGCRRVSCTCTDCDHNEKRGET